MPVESTTFTSSRPSDERQPESATAKNNRERENSIQMEFFIFMQPQLYFLCNHLFLTNFFCSRSISFLLHSRLAHSQLYISLIVIFIYLQLVFPSNTHQNLKLRNGELWLKCLQYLRTASRSHMGNSRRLT